MALFDKADLLADEKETKTRLKTALASKVGSAGAKFLYYEKFKLGSKEVPLVLVDYSADMQSQVKAKFAKAPSALGHCRVNDSDELVFESDTGQVKLDNLKSFLASIGVARKVCVSADAPPADTKPKTLDGPIPKASATQARSDLDKRASRLPRRPTRSCRSCRWPRRWRRHGRQRKLVGEMTRLRALVQQHIDRKGRWPGE